MLAAAALITAALLLVAVVVPPRLARASWPVRAPVPALVLWQALGLVGGLLALELAATLALVPYGDTHSAALGSVGSHPLAWTSVLAAAVGLAVLLRLLQVLVRSTARTVRERRTHRALVDLVATRNPLLQGIEVVGSDHPVAYCLPGLRPRVVVSSGALTRLTDAEVDAVLAHEQAHVVQRHDLVVLPFLALRATFPALPGVQTASREVALLIELLADDRAVRSADPAALARALCKVGSGAPAGGLGIGGAVGGRDGPDGVLLRATRLLDPPPRLPRPASALALLAAGLVAALPPLGLVVPLL